MFVRGLCPSVSQRMARGQLSEKPKGAVRTMTKERADCLVRNSDRPRVLRCCGMLVECSENYDVWHADYSE